MSEGQNGFNEAFAYILRRMGYKGIAAAVKKKEESCREEWLRDKMPDLYFTRLPERLGVMQEISRYHRGIFYDAFCGVPKSVIELAEDKKTLAALCKVPVLPHKCNPGLVSGRRKVTLEDS